MTSKTKGLRKGAAPAKIRAAAEAEYVADRSAAPDGTTPLSPARAKREIAAKVGRPVEGIVDPVYFRENGLANPIEAKSAKGLASALRKRRDGGGTLGRWESVAASAAVSVAVAKALYSKGGGDLDSSYTGRGTRVGAPKTYSDLASSVRVDS
jgi:hypothetical protein